ncbi:MAG TPA: T9SS type A sorting domain-containing protein [Bacteroidia bacterium]
MIKKLTFLLSLLLSTHFVQAQIKSVNVVIKDDLVKQSFVSNSPKRSATNPKSCDVDTVEFPRYRASSLYTVSVSGGRSLGQLYSCPKPISLRGFTFYAFVIGNPPPSKKMNLICNVYKAGPDSLPRGLPLRSDTVTIDSTFGGGQLTKIEKHANWAAITLDSNYIITIETDSTTMSAGVVTNNYNAGDGKRFNLNCGAISGLWYNGRNLNVGSVPFDCDILLHPHVKYSFGTDFTIKSNCYNINDTVKFTNISKGNMAGSKMYNRYLNFGSFNYEYLCHYWDVGNGNGIQYTVDQKVKYANKQNYQIMLVSTVYGFRGNMIYGCTDTAIKDLYFKPDVPSLSGQTSVCIGDTLKIRTYSNDFGVSYDWFDKVTSSKPFFTGTDYTQFPIAKSDTMYIRAVNNTCLSSFRVTQISALDYPKNFSVLNDSVCAGSKANLKANSSLGSLKWYTQSVGGSPFFTGSVYQTPVLNKDTSFYVEAANAQCVISPRLKVDALVGANFAPAPPVMSNDTIVCLGSGNAVTINANAQAGLTIRWFANASGGIPINLGNTYSYLPTIREVKTFYADAFNGVCGSSREAMNLTIESHPSISSIMKDTICKGDSAYLAVSIPFGVADWYDANTGGNLIYTGSTYALEPSATTQLFVETSSGVCKSPTRTLVTALVNTYPAFTKLWGDTICAKNTARLNSALSGPGTVTWYDTDTGDLVLGTGKTLVTSVLNSGRKFYASTSYAGCVGPKVAVQPTVKATPFSGFQFEVLTWQQVRVSPINPGPAKVFWDMGDGFTSTLNTVTHRYPTPGTYFIKLVLTSTQTACKDSTIIPVTIEESDINDIANTPAFNAYPNPTKSTFVLESSDLGYEAETLYIYNINGALVKTINAIPVDGKIVLDLSALANGVYVIKCDGYKVTKVVKSE